MTGFWSLIISRWSVGLDSIRFSSLLLLVWSYTTRCFCHHPTEAQCQPPSTHTPCLPPHFPTSSPTDLAQVVHANDVCRKLWPPCCTSRAAFAIISANRCLALWAVSQLRAPPARWCTPSVVCTCYVSQVCCPCLVCLTLWAVAVCLTVAGYEDVGQASGSGDFCKGGYGTAVAAAASAQSKPASSVTGPGVGECRQIKTKKGGGKTNPVPPVLSLCHQPFFSTSASPFLCLIAN